MRTMGNTGYDYSAEDAWRAYDNGDYGWAGHIWLTLMQRPQTIAVLNRCQQNFVRVLIALERYQEAQRMLQELYTRTGHARYLHQMACLARRTGQLKKAQRLFLTEKAHLDPEDHVAMVLNTYELGLTAWLRQDYALAMEYAEISLLHANQAGDPTCKGLAHRLLGDLLLAANRRGDARCCYLAALDAFSQADDRQAVDALRRSLAELRNPLPWEQLLSA